MSKIIQAINAMISNPAFITDVHEHELEYFFLYKGKYKWSIKVAEDTINLWFYPGLQSLDELVHTRDWQYIPMIHYSSKDIGTKEAKASLNELYNLVKEKLYSVDKVLDDIIADLEDDLPF